MGYKQTWTLDDLETQFERVNRMGWMPFALEAAEITNKPVALMLAVPSRETELDPHYLVEPGDQGNGFGLWQSDKRTHKAWIQTGAWRDPRECFRFGAQALKAELGYVKHYQGRMLRYHDEPFAVPLLGSMATQAGIASYNCGATAALHGFARFGDVDKHTAHGNYSADVLRRAEVFERLLHPKA